MNHSPHRKRPRLRVLLGIVIGTPIVLLIAWIARDWMEHARKAKFPTAPPPHPARLVVEPVLAELGRRSQCDGLIRIKGTLRNASSEPAVLSDWIASCGCTVPVGRIRKGMIVAPGESVDFEVTSDSWAISGEKNYYLDFIESFAEAPVRFHIHYIVESPLYTDSGQLVRMVDGPTSFKVFSRDKKPFRMLAVEPPIASFDSSLEAAEHPMTIDWSKADAVIGAGWIEQELLIKTDRAECPTLHLRMLGQLDVDIADPEPVTPKAATTTPR